MVHVHANVLRPGARVLRIEQQADRGLPARHADENDSLGPEDFLQIEGRAVEPRRGIEVADGHDVAEGRDARHGQTTVGGRYSPQTPRSSPQISPSVA